MEYQRHGGIAGFSNDLGVYSAGYALISTYNGHPAALKKIYLDAGQLKKLYRCLDTYQLINYQQPAPANVADGMSIALVVAGTGNKVASDQDIRSMLNFASGLATR